MIFLTSRIVIRYYILDTDLEETHSWRVLETPTFLPSFADLEPLTRVHSKNVGHFFLDVLSTVRVYVSNQLWANSWANIWVRLF